MGFFSGLEKLNVVTPHYSHEDSSISAILHCQIPWLVLNAGFPRFHL